MLLFLTACFIGDEAWDDRVDVDGDGFPALELGGTDCDDGDASIHPGADEACDGVDSDCDGAEEDLTDADGDGVSVCQQDCDDADAERFPGNPEACDAIDNDCDLVVDDGLDLTEFFLDADSDGFGLPREEAGTVTACTAPEGYTARSGDCDDTDATLNPDTTWYADADGDGAGDPDSSATMSCEPPATTGWVRTDGDCDDTTAEVGPGVDESTGGRACNGVDDDCDPTTHDDDVDADNDGYLACADDCDDGDAELNPASSWLLDGDGDGWGTDTSVTGCAQPSGFVLDRGLGLDCDDANDSVNPGVDESLLGRSCNGVDDDCTPTSFAYDVDADGDGALACDDDCDDSRPDITPDMLWYVDGDADGYGTGAEQTGCSALPTSWASFDGDCDDTDGALYHGNGTVAAGTDLVDHVLHTCEGSRLELAAGTFTLGSTLVFDKDLELVGDPSGTDLVGSVQVGTSTVVELQNLLIDGGAAGRCLEVDGIVTLSEVDLLDCAATGSGGGVLVASGGELDWSVGSCTGCTATEDGDAISASGATVALSSLDLGGSVKLASSNVVVDTVRIAPATADSGALLELVESTSVSVDTLWADGDSSLVPLADAGVLAVSMGGGGAVDLVRVRADEVDRGVELNGVQGALEHSTITAYGQVGVRVAGAQTSRVEDTVIGYPSSTSGTGLDLTASPTALSLAGVYIVAPGISTDVDDPGTTWTDCEAEFVDPNDMLAACDVFTAGLSSPPDDVTLTQGPNLRRITQPGVNCQGIDPPGAPPATPDPCFQSGIYGTIAPFDDAAFE